MSEYESPVKIVSQLVDDINKKRDTQIMLAIKTHVDVDKEELIKALNYDRHQYEKGYEDCKAVYEKALEKVCDYCKRNCSGPIEENWTLEDWINWSLGKKEELENEYVRVGRK